MGGEITIFHFVYVRVSLCVFASPGNPGGKMCVYVGERQTNVSLGFEILANKIKYQNTIRILSSSDNQL